MRGQRKVNRYAIIKAKMMHAPFIVYTDASTRETLIEELGDIGNLVPEGPVMVIDFEDRRVYRLGFNEDGSVKFADNADIAFGDLTEWTEF
jgi:hypothetical protein